jgi:hypothetical protein
MIEKQSAAMKRRQGGSFPSRFFRFGLAKDGVYRFSPDSLPDEFKLIGDGQIGGKARGLLFVIDHLKNEGPLTEYDHLLRFPDSLVVTTAIFDAFMAENNLNEVIRAHCRQEIGSDELGKRIVSAVFPTSAREALAGFLAKVEHPLVVRSSSVMEDDPEHSFAGIYRSEFLSNVGSDEERLTALIAAIKRVYASTFGQNASAYRKRHDLPWQEEKMAILIQNMIGCHYPPDLFYPLIGGVGFSLNFYPWTDRLLPEDGVVRLVVGVGTRTRAQSYAAHRRRSTSST